MEVFLILVIPLAIIGFVCYLIARSVRKGLIRAGNRYHTAWSIASFLLSFALILTCIFLFLSSITWGR